MTIHTLTRLATPHEPFSERPVCLLPGPVAIADRVTAAFHEPLVYHRDDDFLPLFEGVREKLREMVDAPGVAIFVGSGTAANDAVAATLAAAPGADNGLVLVTGEFGGRLLKQANRWGLAPKHLTTDWGSTWQLDAVEEVFRGMPPGGWVWGTHHETSSGTQNDLPGLLRLAARYGHRVCVDCVSSLGTVPVDLSQVYLATGASGKAIGSYAGLAFVFADPTRLTHVNTERVPSYLDVLSTLNTVGPRFTVPSALVKALDVALDVFASPRRRAARFAHIAELGRWVRHEFLDRGIVPMAPARVANPAIVTFAPPDGQSSPSFVQQCRAWGYQIAGQSGYLAERRLVQLAVMGDLTRDDIEPFFSRLSSVSR